MLRPILIKSKQLIKVRRFESVRCFWEPYRKGDLKYEKEDPRPYLKQVSDGLGLMKGEFKLLSQEIDEALHHDPKIYMPGDTDIIWTFNSKDNLKKWKVTADKDNLDGFSNCQLELSKNKKGLFHGFLDTQTPKDGVTYRSGYCNISTHRARKSFMRDAYLDWKIFTHLAMRVRGDGRNYMVNISTAGTFDLTWNDMYSFILYTRGGPYWQNVKIPFSKFFLSSKGNIQDKQMPIPLHMVSSVGITCSAVKGPFQLEIDYIGVHFDPNHKEEFAYEMYQTPNLNLF